MGDYYQIVVIAKIDEDEASTASDQVRQWLIEEDIILPEMSDCILGNPLGHRPGSAFSKAVEDEGAMYVYWLKLRTNGLNIRVGRQVFIGLRRDFRLRCQTCGFLESDSFQREIPGLNEAIDNWWNNLPTTDFACPRCGSIEPLEDLDFDDTLAVGYLGFEFWNWPKLKGSFVADIGGLIGYEAKVVSGKL